MAVIVKSGGAGTGADDCGAGVLEITGCGVVGTGTGTGVCSGDCTVGTETLGDVIYAKGPAEAVAGNPNRIPVALDGLSRRRWILLNLTKRSRLDNTWVRQATPAVPPGAFCI